MRYASRILLGGAIVWAILSHLGHADPLWAIISTVVVTDPQLESALIAFRSRLTNTLVGCAVGVAFLFVLGGSALSILLAMATAVVVSGDLLRVPVSWRIAPITVAIVMTPAILGGSTQVAEHAALARTGEVLLGSAVAVFVTFITSPQFLPWRLLKGQGRQEHHEKVRVRVSEAAK